MNDFFDKVINDDVWHEFNPDEPPPLWPVMLQIGEQLANGKIIAEEHNVYWANDGEWHYGVYIVYNGRVTHWRIVKNG